MGGDFARVVTDVGEEVNGFKKGDEVYGTAMVLSGGVVLLPSMRWQIAQVLP